MSGGSIGMRSEVSRGVKGLAPARRLLLTGSFEIPGVARMVAVVRARCWLLAVVLLAAASAPAAAAPCPGAASLDIAVEKLSPATSLTGAVEAELPASHATCSGGGVASYTPTVTCDTSASTPCGRIDGLRPGAWVHRIRLQVPGSDEQVQSQRMALLAAGPGVSNVVLWTVYPRTFVVRDVSGQALVSRLDEAAAFTASMPGVPALVTFDRGKFPDAQHPRVISLPPVPGGPGVDPCREEFDRTCSDGRATAYCFEGSMIVVDGLDDDARPGAVELSVGVW